MKLIFATSNEGKLREAKEILDVEVEGTTLEIDEVQSLDNVVVATKKAKLYFDEVKKPLFVDDNGLFFEALNGLPGPYIGDFLKAIDVAGLLNLIKDNSNRKAKAVVVIAYIDEFKKVHTFEGVVNGIISNEPRGTNGFGWDSIFIPEGTKKTFAEMTSEEKNDISMRKLALHKFREWLDLQKNLI